MKIRAVYIGDVRFDQCPVFELNPETGYFEMISDKEFRYEKEAVKKDSNFLIFVVDGGEPVLVAKSYHVYRNTLKELF